MRPSAPHKHDHDRDEAAAKKREQKAQAAKRVAKARVSSSDPKANATVRAFVRAFREANVDGMTAACALPLRAHGRVVARTKTDVHRALKNLVDEANATTAGPVELMTAMEARDKIGRVPEGVQYGKPQLVGRVKLGGQSVLLILERRHASWKIVGLNK